MDLIQCNSVSELWTKQCIATLGHVGYCYDGHPDHGPWEDKNRIGYKEASSPLPNFLSFSHIRRLSRDIVVTEKLDGTNGQIFVSESKQIIAGSRSKWLSTETKQSDNAGFAKWVEAHKDELIEGLGPGRHYGEWWGQGIQRTYGLKEKRFSLFNVSRWSDNPAIRGVNAATGIVNSPRPSCCGIVPTLYRGVFDTTIIDDVLKALELHGSVAAPGFMKPEGIVVYHEAAKTLFKKTLGGDGHKGANA